jgi:acyl-coenzyme A synthetase/AMP-(fatty) acid ligase
MHPADAIFYWAKAAPERIAILQLGVAITYRALAEAIEASAERIERFGLNRSEPVAVAVDDPARFLAVCFALLRSGITCAPINRRTFPHLQSNNINTLLFSGESGLIVGGRNIRFDDSWLKREGKNGLVWNSALASEAANADMIFFTSGTTGTPKKMIVPGGAAVGRARISPFYSDGSFERVLVVPGLTSTFGFFRTSTVLLAGKTACFAGTPEAQLLLANNHGIEVIYASPQQVSELVEFIETSEKKYRLDFLKECRIGGGFVSRDLVNRIKSILCRIVRIEYGSTETGIIATANYDMIADIPGAVGLPLPGTSIEIANETNISLPAGEEGLVRCRNSQFLKNFVANYPDRAAEVNNVWWYSGDLGHLTEDGVLCLGGRADDVINMGGVKVRATKLDEAALRYPGIRDAGVCGVRGQSGIEEVWVGIVPDAKIDLMALRKALEGSQDSTIKVGEILVVEKIPRNDLGKLERHQLKALLLGMKNRALLEV